MFYMPNDTETGGTDPKKTDLLTIYACIMDEDYKILEEVDLKLKPNDGRFPIAEQGALDVNKIDLKQHMENPETITYKEGSQRLIEMIERYAQRKGRFSNMTAYGFNVPFDKGYIQEYLIPKEKWDKLFHYKDCDIDQAVSMLRRYKWVPKDVARLQDAADYFGVPKRLAHSAKDDTLRTIDLDKKIIELMNSKKEGGQTQDLISLLEAE